jgi:fluoroquinolone resistance protein
MSTSLVRNTSMNNDDFNKLALNHRRWWDSSGVDGQRLEVAAQEISDLDLTGTILDRASFKEVVFRRTKLAGAHLRHTSLTRVQFVECDLTGASFDDSEVRDSTLSGARADGVSFTAARLYGCDLSEIHAEGSFFNKCLFRSGSLKHALLRRANLIRLSAYDSTFVGATLDNCNLTACIVSHCDWRRVSLEGAYFERGNLEHLSVSGIKGRLRGCLDPRVSKPDFSDAGDGSRIGTAEEFLTAIAPT